MRPDQSSHDLVDHLRAIARGDKNALEALYRQTSAKLFGICLRILPDRHEAEDVLQDVYIAVWRNAGRFDAQRASPITWLVAVARNRSIDRLRSLGPVQRRQPIEFADKIEDSVPNALATLERSDERRRLEDCLGTLEDAHRKAVKTAFFDGATYEELAHRFGIPLGTMKSWIRRSLIKLRECLGS